MKNSFLQIVVDDLIGRVGMTGLENCTMVFPMQRAGLFVKQYIRHWVEQSPDTPPIVLPHFTTIDNLVDSLCDLQAEEEIVSVCSLYTIYKKHTHHTLPIDAFYGWGLQLLNDFSSADMARLDASRLMDATAQAARLDELELDEETQHRLEKLLRDTVGGNSVRAYYTDLWDALPRIYNELHAQHLQAGVGSRGERTRWVLEHFQDASIQQRIAGRTYVFVGFNYLLSAERELMKRLKDQSLFYWDESKHFTLDEEVYKFLNSEVKTFGNCLPEKEKEASFTQADIAAVACQSSAAQAQYVRDWLKEHHHAGDRTAIVIADESLLQEVVYALPESSDEIEHVNITKGYPLGQTRLYADVVSDMDKAVKEKMPIMDILPYVAGQLEHGYQSMERSGQNSWQMVLLDESYYQIQLALRQMQMLLRQNDLVRREITEQCVLRNLVKRQLEMVTIPFHGEPVTDIQIIGVLETRLLDFDHVLILNVEEGVVPSRPNDRSFLPFDLRREYHMATREEEAKIYAYNFFRLFRRAQDVTLTFCDSFTDQGKRTMSRFLMQMLCQDALPIQKYRLTESTKVEACTIGKTIFQAEDKLPPYISPSAISEYITCPRWFFLDKIKQISTSDADSILLPPNVIGTLVHSTLETIYLTMSGAPEVQDGGKRTLRQPYEVTKEKVEAYRQDKEALSRALDHAYEEVNEDYNKHHTGLLVNPYDRSLHEAENYAILAMVDNVLARDISLAPFTLIRLEEKVDMNVEGIGVCGVVDRIDVIRKDGEQYIRILDYKTGSYDKKKVEVDWESVITNPDKRYALQTLMYCEMVSRKAEELGLDVHLPLRPELLYPRQLSTQGDLWLGSGKESTVIGNYREECQEEFLRSLTKVLHQIKANAKVGEEFVMQEDERICKDSYCPFHMLCGREKSTHF